MTTRALVAVGLGMVLSACANDQRPDMASLNSATLNTASLVVTAAPIAEAELTAATPSKKTMSDRVLTAIALERVTGMKPDPGRLLQ